MNRYSPIGATRDGSRNAKRDVQSDAVSPTGEAGAPNLSTECSSCEQPYDPAGWCERCQQFAHEELPEKTLAQWIAENPDAVARIANAFLEAQVRQLGDGTVRLEL